MSHKLHWNKSTVIFGGAAVWALLLVGCVMADRTMIAPPSVPGATFVGSAKCSECHDSITSKFHDASHAKLMTQGEDAKDIGCESCHGAGSVHVKSGGTVGTIVNPGNSPEACFTCHLDKRAQFSLPHSHPVLAGQMSCADCHDTHSGNAVRGTGAALEAQNETCTKCHTQQKGPFVFEHSAMKEGCVSCHNPHGSVNQKMLVARDANLCTSCHLVTPTVANAGQINIGINDGTGNHNTRLMQGACWTAGCHETPHGSNANNHFRR